MRRLIARLFDLVPSELLESEVEAVRRVEHDKATEKVDHLLDIHNAELQATREQVSFLQRTIDHLNARNMRLEDDLLKYNGLRVPEFQAPKEEGELKPVKNGRSRFDDVRMRMQDLDRLVQEEINKDIESKKAQFKGKFTGSVDHDVIQPQPGA